MNEYLPIVAVAISLASILISLSVVIIRNRTTYLTMAADLNQQLARDKSITELILKMRRDPVDATEVELFRYHLHLFGLVQYYDSDNSMLRRWVLKPIYETGYGSVIEAALNCPGGEKFWRSNRSVFSTRMRKFIDGFIEADGVANNRPLYPVP